jgi:hypothetical protein
MFNRQAFDAEQAARVARLVARVEARAEAALMERWTRPTARRGRDHAERAAEPVGAR